MSKFVDSLLLIGRPRPHQRPTRHDSGTPVDFDLPRNQMRQAQPFLLGSLIARTG